ncbi:MAG: hypothetical protein EOP00_16250 [Pedobacter sp.]|nr:MAG: hypothetical protein EOP00_16250 [Pedobacter sp.]
MTTSLQKASAQLYFSNIEGSQVKISSSSNNAQFAPITRQFTCEGKFNMINGELVYLNDLKFNLPINAKAKDEGLISATVLNSIQPKNDINFELTHSMVLPELNMIHAIGYLDIQGVKTRVNFNLDYIANTNETITIIGRRSIKLSDYKKNHISVFADKKTQDIIQIDLKLVIKNPAKVEYIASLAK